MKKQLLFIHAKSFLASWFLILPLTTLGQLSIEDCQEKARNNYPLIRQLDLIGKSAEYSISNANKAHLPQFSINAIGGYLINGLPAAPGTESENGTTKVILVGQLNQTIWDGGATKARKDIIQTNSDVEKANIEVALYTVKERVNQLFFSILIIDEQLRNVNILRQNLQRNLSRMKQSVDNGLAYTSDADELRVELLKIDQRKDEFTFTRKAYINMLGLLIGESLNENVQLTKPTLPETLSPEIHRPELVLYSYQRNAAEEQNKQSKVNLMPKIGLLAFGVSINPGTKFGAGTLSSLSIAGVSASWNTAGLYLDKNIRQQTRINMDRIRNQEETFLFNTNLQATQQNNEIEKQKSILMKDDEIIALRSAIKKSYELKYQNGMCSVNDMILAVNTESEASSNKTLHEIQLMLSLYNYKTTTGN